jgi:hypothetical protein
MTKSLSKLMVLLSALALLAIGAASAQAETSYWPAGTFASTQGPGDGELSDPQDLAVETSTGNILLVDRGNNRVQVFAPDGSGLGTYLTQFGTGVLNAPLGIAIDQSTGDVYVSDATQVVKFDTDGAPVPTYTQDLFFTSPAVTGPLAFDQTAHQLLVAATDHVRRYSTVGAAGASFDGATSGIAFTNLKDIAIQDDGDVVVIDDLRIVRFKDDNGYAATLNAGVGPVALTAVPGTDNLLVGQNAGYTPDSATYNLFSHIRRYAGDTLTGTSVPPANIQGFYGLAVGGDSAHQLYATVGPGNYTGGDVAVASFTPFVVQAPVVSELAALPSQVGARLTAKVNPNKDATTWTFEYGHTTAYGQQHPVVPATIAAGTDPVDLAHKLGGLDPGTTYHYRLVATNVAGTTTSADMTFSTAPVRLPTEGERAGGREYEQVTPANAGAIPDLRYPVLTTPSGDTVAFSVASALPGAPSSLLYGYGIARRGVDNWSTVSADVPQSVTKGTIFTAQTVRAISKDLGRVLTSSKRALTPGAIEGGSNFYYKDTLTGEITLAYADADPRLRVKYSSLLTPRDAAASSDVSHVALTNGSVFDVTGGRLDLLGSVGGAAPAEGTRVSTPAYEMDNNVMSKDGRRVYFMSNADGGLYLRQDGQTTIPISASQRAGDDPSIVHPADFVGASDDGSIVYFRSYDWLTDNADSGRNLYRYNVNSQQLTSLTISGHPEAFFEYNLASVFDVSADGSTVYFDFYGPLADAPADGEGGIRMYVAHGNTVHYLGKRGSGSFTDMSISPSGRYMVYTDNARLTDYDNQGHNEVYRYDRDLSQLTCVSCGPAPHLNRASGTVHPQVNFSERPRSVLDDGRVFYESLEALVPRDTNGKLDVYEWRDGTNVLISPGTGDADASFANVTPDGRNVFFSTAERLVGQDRDTLSDLYVARTGGGLAGQADTTKATRPCRDDGCQGDISGRRDVPAPGSDVGSGRGDAPAEARAAFSGGLPSAKQAATLARGGSVTVRVKVSRPGKVTVRGTTAIGGKTVAVVSASQRARAAGTVSLRLKLSATGLRRLRSARAMTVRFAVGFEGVRQAKVATVRLRRPSTATKAGTGAHAASPVAIHDGSTTQNAR